MKRNIPAWLRWAVFGLFTCLWLFWFSGYPEGHYDKIDIVELSDYTKQLIVEMEERSSDWSQ